MEQTAFNKLCLFADVTVNLLIDTFKRTMFSCLLVFQCIICIFETSLNVSCDLFTLILLKLVVPNCVYLLKYVCILLIRTFKRTLHSSLSMFHSLIHVLGVSLIIHCLIRILETAFSVAFD